MKAKLIAILLLTLFLSVNGLKIWSNNKIGDFGDAKLWSGGSVPNNGEDVLIQTTIGHRATAVLNYNASFNTITIDTNCILQIMPNVVLSAQNVFLQSSASTLLLLPQSVLDSNLTVGYVNYFSPAPQLVISSNSTLLGFVHVNNSAKFSVSGSGVSMTNLILSTGALEINSTNNDQQTLTITGSVIVSDQVCVFSHDGTTVMFSNSLICSDASANFVVNLPVIFNTSTINQKVSVELANISLFTQSNFNFGSIVSTGQLTSLFFEISSSLLGNGTFGATSGVSVWMITDQISIHNKVIISNASVIAYPQNLNSTFEDPNFILQRSFSTRNPNLIISFLDTVEIIGSAFVQAVDITYSSTLKVEGSVLQVWSAEMVLGENSTISNTLLIPFLSLTNTYNYSFAMFQVESSNISKAGVAVLLDFDYAQCLTNFPSTQTLLTISSTTNYDFASHLYNDSIGGVLVSAREQNRDLNALLEDCSHYSNSVCGCHSMSAPLGTTTCQNRTWTSSVNPLIPVFTNFTCVEDFVQLENLAIVNSNHQLIIKLDNTLFSRSINSSIITVSNTALLSGNITISFNEELDYQKYGLNASMIQITLISFQQAVGTSIVGVQVDPNPIGCQQLCFLSFTQTENNVCALIQIVQVPCSLSVGIIITIVISSIDFAIIIAVAIYYIRKSILKRSERYAMLKGFH